MPSFALDFATDEYDDTASSEVPEDTGVAMGVALAAKPDCDARGGNGAARRDAARGEGAEGHLCDVLRTRI
jgi:hypothetical protein